MTLDASHICGFQIALKTVRLCQETRRMDTHDRDKISIPHLFNGDIVYQSRYHSPRTGLFADVYLLQDVQ